MPQTSRSAGADITRIAAAEFFGTMVLMLIGPGSAILAADVIGASGRGAGVRLRAADDGLRHRPRIGMPHQPGRDAGVRRHRQAPGRPRRLLLGRAGRRRPSPAGCCCSSSPRAASQHRRGHENLDQTGIFAANGWGDKIGSGFGLGAVIVVEIVFTALLIFVVLSTTDGGLPDRVRWPRRRPDARRDPPRHDPGRQHVGEPGPQHRGRDLLRRRRHVAALGIHRLAVGRRSRRRLRVGLHPQLARRPQLAQGLTLNRTPRGDRHRGFETGCAPAVATTSRPA